MTSTVTEHFYVILSAQSHSYFVQYKYIALNANVQNLSENSARVGAS